MICVKIYLVKPAIAPLKRQGLDKIAPNTYSRNKQKLTLSISSRLTGLGGNFIQKRWQDFVIKSDHQKLIKKLTQLT